MKSQRERKGTAVKAIAKGAKSVSAAERKAQASTVKAAILAAAFDVFSMYGFDGATFRKIAQRAGASEQLIVYHFESKTRLWRAAVTWAMTKPAADIEAILSAESMSATMKLRRLIEVEVRLFADYPGIYRIMIIEGQPGSPRLKWFNDHYGTHGFESMLRVITAAQSEGTTRRIAPERLRYAILGAAAIHATSSGYEEFTGRNPSSEEEILATIDFINRMVFFDG